MALCRLGDVHSLGHNRFFLKNIAAGQGGSLAAVIFADEAVLDVIGALVYGMVNALYWDSKQWDQSYHFNSANAAISFTIAILAVMYNEVCTSCINHTL